MFAYINQLFMKKISYLAVALVIAFAVSCKKDSTSTPSTTTTPTVTPTPVSVNSTPQFTATINDTNYSMVTGSVYSGGTIDNNMIGGSGATYNTGNYGSYMANTNTNQPCLTITKGTLEFSLVESYPDSALFDAYFATGTYSYSVNLSTANGIQIQWINSKGDIYSTAQGSGTQTGSTFTITEKHALGMVYGSYEVAVMATFNCTLYSTTGTSITLTNGVYVGDFSPQ
jgi:hypothetical protein